jgi:hypothetical protein
MILRVPRWALLIPLVVASAVPSWGQQSFLPFRRSVDASKDKTYWLSQQEGPWLIMCASFSGENGIHQANDLVHELRSKHSLNAFVYKMKFDLPDTVNGAGMGIVEIVDDKHFIARHEQMTFANASDIEEVAVVVGNFATHEDRAALSTLEKIKTLRPESLSFSESVPTSQSFGYLREFYRRVSGNSEIKNRGPMGQAFLIPNPLLPEEYFARQQADTVILNLNKDIKYGLLSCPAPYSVRVATFRGEVTFDLSKMEQWEQEEKRLLKFNQAQSKSKLAEAGEKAHHLTNELRKQGIEAYEFHDRSESYVCVGSFDWVRRRGADGKEEWNNEVVETINKYKASVEDRAVKNFPGLGRPLRPKTLQSLRGTDIVFDIQPIPVQVPVAGYGKR